jgi:26S proteasome regulatory subunit T5
VIAATNRVDILDPALLRSGRIDRKIEFPLPGESGRARIMQIHSRKMNVNSEVNFEELGRCTDDFNGAQLKARPRPRTHPHEPRAVTDDAAANSRARIAAAQAVCVEAGMIALRAERTEIVHEDFMEGVTVVQAKKKASLAYYA